MTTKEFIENLLIKEIGEITETHPYLSFGLITKGIEFLGKCLNPTKRCWYKHRNKKYFNLAIKQLRSFLKYRTVSRKYNLWYNLKYGISDNLLPKKLSFSSKDEAANLQITDAGLLNLRAEDFYNDFKNACLEVIAIEDLKLSKEILSVPEKKLASPLDN